MTSKQGGKRDGAGRPPKHQTAMIQCTVRLPEHWRSDLIKEYGSLQKAIESLVQSHRG